MGLVPPSDFIPVAEETGLIVPIGNWVIREALAEAARWPGELKIAVNVSSVQLVRGSLITTLVQALAASGIGHERVEIEITESVFLENSEQSLDTLRQLRALGVRIALDDFGTGFSALGYLLAFPFDKIKIDGTFIRALDSAEGRRDHRRGRGRYRRPPDDGDDRRRHRDARAAARRARRRLYRGAGLPDLAADVPRRGPPPGAR